MEKLGFNGTNRKEEKDKRGGRKASIQSDLGFM